ncbi:proline iminopeptidase [Robbsia andropogonis]|uniref:alpha/beta fold hydrolase n=1 Tax=Robbsia andropogonis TaxID=28092 RepID=UPI003D2066CD
MTTAANDDVTFPHFADGQLPVGHGHAIYWRAHGRPDAPVVLIVHGGPGGALNPSWAQFFDPLKWRVVLFDQRGCGRSTPFGKTEHNGLSDLVGDIEALRTALGIERWALFGGSWGTTLALAYGIAHPERCTAFLLRGIFLARREDIDWFLWDVRRVFPEAHDRFLDAIERADGRRPRNRDQILEYAAAPLSRFDAAGVALAKAWSGFEAKLSSVGSVKPKTPADAGAVPKPAPAAPVEEGSSREAEQRAVSMALLEHHYMAHELPAPDFLSRVHALQDHPCIIVHGRFDMVCPADQAVALHAAWPSSQLRMIDASGHWTFEPGIAAALHDGADALGRAIGGGR